MSVAAVVVASEIYLHGDNQVFTNYALIIKLPQTYSTYHKFSSHVKFYLCTVGQQKIMTINSLVMSYNWLETMESLTGNYDNVLIMKSNLFGLKIKVFLSV